MIMLYKNFLNYFLNRVFSFKKNMDQCKELNSYLNYTVLEDEKMRCQKVHMEMIDIMEEVEMMMDTMDINKEFVTLMGSEDG